MFSKERWRRNPVHQCSLVMVLHSYPDPVSTKAGFTLLSLQGHMHNTREGLPMGTC